LIIIICVVTALSTIIAEFITKFIKIGKIVSYGGFITSLFQIVRFRWETANASVTVVNVVVIVVIKIEVIIVEKVLAACVPGIIIRLDAASEVRAALLRYLRRGRRLAFVSFLIFLLLYFRLSQSAGSLLLHQNIKGTIINSHLVFIAAELDHVEVVFVQFEGVGEIILVRLLICSHLSINTELFLSAHLRMKELNLVIFPV
jgi:hypothetical protein